MCNWRRMRAMNFKYHALFFRQINFWFALVAHKLEETYLFPLDAPRFVGVSFGSPLSFFSAITFHYGIAGVLLWMLASYRASQLVPSFAPNFAPLNFYFPVTIGWTLVNVFYLAWYFIGQRDEQRVEQILSEFVKEKAQ